MNGLPRPFVSLTMVPAARFTRFVVASSLLSVPAVPAFAQSNINLPASLERTSATAAARYDPASTSPRTGRPYNLVVVPGLSSVVDMMLERSGTFRRQCARIAGVRHLTVRLERPGWLPAGMRARMRMMREGLRLIALVEIPPLDDTVELIAHEIEHVIEQLDGIDLRAHARRSHGSVHATAADPTKFETRRARRVGLLIAQEVREWPSNASLSLRR